MIDLHSHILPGIDDGAKNLDISLEMARLAVADGIHTMACTPHIYPGLYMNSAQGIAQARDALQAELDAQGIALRLVLGADVHLVPGLLAGLRFQRAPHRLHVDAAGLPQALERSDQVAALERIHGLLRDRGIGSAHRHAPDRIARA